MTEGQKQFLIALLNGGVINYVEVQRNTKIYTFNMYFNITRDDSGLICDIDYTGFEPFDFRNLLLQAGFPESVDDLLEQIETSEQHRVRYHSNYSNVFKLYELYNYENILELKNSDLQNALFNRINDKRFVYQMYPFFYINDLPDAYRAENALTIKLPFIKIDRIEAEFMGEINPLDVFEGAFPIHPSLIENSIISADIAYKEECYFSVSHRTFTKEDLDFYFKIDVPYRISSSNRILSRSADKLAASSFLRKKMKYLSSDLNLTVLTDVGHAIWKKNNVIIRTKTNKGITIPLFALTGCSPFEAQGRTFLEWYLEENSLDPFDTVLNEIVYPILKTFSFFIKISRDSGTGKFIQPYNFHSQNIGISLINNRIKGIVVQDLDQQLDLTALHIAAEFDTCVSRFILIPLQNILHQKYGIPKRRFQQAVSAFMRALDPKEEGFWMYDPEVKDRAVFHNLIKKDISAILPTKVNSYFYSQANPFR